MLATSFPLHDIRDAEGFVKATLKQSGIRFTREQHEHMVAEGLAELVKLADRFEPHRPGYEQPGRFSGYAAKYLRLRLDRSWHKYMGAKSQTDPETGKRSWDYPPVPAQITEATLERLGDQRYEGWSNADRLMEEARERIPGVVEVAPDQVVTRGQIEAVATRLAQGMTVRDIADEGPGGMRLKDVEAARGCLASAMTAIGVKR